MEASIYTKEEVREKFAAGWHCAQCTLVPWAEALGYDEEELMHMAAAYLSGFIIAHLNVPKPPMERPAMKLSSLLSEAGSQL